MSPRPDIWASGALLTRVRRSLRYGPRAAPQIASDLRISADVAARALELLFLSGEASREAAPTFHTRQGFLALSFHRYRLREP